MWDSCHLVAHSILSVQQWKMPSQRSYTSLSVRWHLWQLSRMARVWFSSHQSSLLWCSDGIVLIQLVECLRWRWRNKLKSLIRLLNVVLSWTVARMLSLCTCILDWRTMYNPRFVWMEPSKLIFVPDVTISLCLALQCAVCYRTYCHSCATHLKYYKTWSIWHREIS